MQRVYQKDLELQKKMHVDLYQTTIDELRSQVRSLEVSGRELELKLGEEPQI